MSAFCEHLGGACSGKGWEPGGVASFAAVLREEGRKDRSAASRVDAASGADGPAMPADDVVGDPESEPGADVVLGGVEGFEYAAEGFARDARA